MPRPSAQPRPGRFLMGLTVFVIAVLSALPPWLIRPLQWFGNVTETLIVPIQVAVEAPARWLLDKVRSPDTESAALEAARAEAERYKTMFLQEQEQKLELLRRYEGLKVGGELVPGLNVRQLVFGVVAQRRSANILQIRAGTGSGIEEGDVAAYDGVHLVGRVASNVAPQLCSVIAITDQAAGGANLEGRGRITGAIIVGETRATLPPNPAAERLICKLAPTGDGTLAGDVAYPPARADRPAPPPIEPGAIVRLLDDRWPPTAQMLVIGAVKRVESKPNQRQVVIVEPLYRLDDVREVDVRIPADRAIPGAGGAP